jgi:WD40 repeat protein
VRGDAGRPARGLGVGCPDAEGLGIESGRALATLEGHGDWVRVCVVTPDGRRVISASTDQTLMVWDFKRGCA